MTTKTRKRPRDRRQGTLDRELGVLVLGNCVRVTDLAVRLNWHLQVLNQRLREAGIEATQRADLPGFGRWVSREDAARMIEAHERQKEQ